MTTKKRVDNQCTGKHKYRNQRIAMFAADRLRRKFQGNIRAYCCPWCGCWHVGNSKRKKATQKELWRAHV